MHEKRLIKASDIADDSNRSLQNISFAMRELEDTEVFEKLKENNLVG
jgi:DNA-binding transcriptional regulator GbsR (MarR family)